VRLDVSGGIGSIKVAEWVDADGDDNAGTIEAGWIGSLSAKGNARTGAAGDFHASLELE
jgi:hypothetical protein